MPSGGPGQAWEHHALEHPVTGDDGNIDWDTFWLYRRKQGVQQPRPVFTGDVFEGVTPLAEDSPAAVVVLQHPCALMDKNNEMRETLLVAKLVDHDEVPISGWTRNYDIMPVVVHATDPPKAQALALDQLGLVRSSDLKLNKRVACMEIDGIALLLQRWTNVNTRVVVPRWRFVQVVESQFAEAEGMEEWASQRRAARVQAAASFKEATVWLNEKSDDTGRPRRLLLEDASVRKHIIRRMHDVAKERADADIAERKRQAEERNATEQAGAEGFETANYAEAEETSPNDQPR